VVSIFYFKINMLCLDGETYTDAMMIPSLLSSFSPYLIPFFSFPLFYYREIIPLYPLICTNDFLSLIELTNIFS